MTRTFSMIKPDAVRRNLAGQINAMIESNGFRIIAQKMIRISYSQAQAFYAEHSQKAFFEDLCKFISSGPVIVQVLSKDEAVRDYRHLMGVTDPAKAAEGTIRKKFALSIDENSVHGSDSAENAEREIHFFFADSELI